MYNTIRTERICLRQSFKYNKQTYYTVLVANTEAAYRTVHTD